MCHECRPGPEVDSEATWKSSAGKRRGIRWSRRGGEPHGRPEQLDHGLEPTAGKARWCRKPLRCGPKPSSAAWSKRPNKVADVRAAMRAAITNTFTGPSDEIRFLQGDPVVVPGQKSGLLRMARDRTGARIPSGHRVIYAMGNRAFPVRWIGICDGRSDRNYRRKGSSNPVPCVDTCQTVG